MTKLDEALNRAEIWGAVEGRSANAYNDYKAFVDAARFYAALLKLAPEIGKLVEAGRHIGRPYTT